MARQGEKFRIPNSSSENSQLLGAYSMDGRPIPSGSRAPFPANKVFRSQEVLSEELKDKIFDAVVKDGSDVATTSAEFGVDMRRVAAVVRLKTIEQNWAREVRLPKASILHDEHNKRLVFKTPTWLHLIISLTESSPQRVRPRFREHR